MSEEFTKKAKDFVCSRKYDDMCEDIGRFLGIDMEDNRMSRIYAFVLEWLRTSNITWKSGVLEALIKEQLPFLEDEEVTSLYYFLHRRNYVGKIERLKDPYEYEEKESGE